MKERQKKALGGLLSLFVFFISILFPSCKAKKQEVAKENIRPVKYYTVHFGNAGANRVYVGVSVAEDEVNLSFRVSGKIAKTYASVGQHVEKGQLLAQLDEHDLKLKYEQALALKEQAKVRFSTAASELNRSKQLYESDAIPISEYEKSRNAYASAKSSYEESIKNENLAKHQLDYTNLYASISGIISIKDAGVNENIQSGSRVMQLSSDNEFEVKVGVPSNFIDYVKVGDEVGLRFSSISNKSFEGKVVRVSYTKSTSSTYGIKIKLLNPTKAVRPGLAAEVTFRTKSLDNDDLLIPDSAVFEDNDGNSYVFLLKVKSNHTAVVHKKLVVLGMLTDSGYEVKSGLKNGDRIVSAGISSMKEGLEVHLLEESLY